MIEDFNQVARRYHVSPARNVTPGAMVELRQKNVSANQLPYQQGYLLAAHWNGRGKSLDLAMRRLAASNGKPLSNARIARALEAIGIANAEKEIQRFILEGRTIELRANLWGDCAAESQTPFRTFDMGFEWTESERAGIIKGAKRGSNAWRSGVRDGQKWTAIDVGLGDPAYLAEIEIEDEQGRRRVKFYPASAEAVMVPQYKATTRECDSAALRGIVDGPMGIKSPSILKSLLDYWSLPD